MARIVHLARGVVGDDPLFANLTSALAVTEYARKAADIATRLEPGAAILDWGCGTGLMSYLLATRGFAMSAVDRSLPPWVVAREAGIEPLLSAGRAPLPFADGMFDAVVSCGVLEHVADPNGRLQELRRVLREDGLLFLYNYPNRTSWIEWLHSVLHGYTLEADEEGNVVGHQRKLGIAALVELVSSNGFRVKEARRENILPLTMRRLPHALRAGADLRAHRLSTVDRVLSRVPGLSLLATNLAIIGQRQA